MLFKNIILSVVAPRGMVLFSNANLLRWCTSLVRQRLSRDSLFRLRQMRLKETCRSICAQRAFCKQQQKPSIDLCKSLRVRATKSCAAKHSIQQETISTKIRLCLSNSARMFTKIKCIVCACFITRQIWMEMHGRQSWSSQTLGILKDDDKKKRSVSLDFPYVAVKMEKLTKFLKKCV